VPIPLPSKHPPVSAQILPQKNHGRDSPDLRIRVIGAKIDIVFVGEGVSHFATTFLIGKPGMP
jgi:hypothetical protein